MQTVVAQTTPVVGKAVAAPKAAAPKAVSVPARIAQTVGGAAAALAVVASPAVAAYSVPDLPYPYESLEPVIDTETMHLHHDKHHAAYVGKLNGALDAAPSLKDMSLLQLMEEVGTSAVPAEVNGVVRNNGGGHWNHAFFWTIMKPAAAESKATSELSGAIDSAFGSMDAMKEKFNAAGANQFGSGWAWLIVKPDGSLAVTSTPNQDNPLMKSYAGETGIPILGCDVWEHAYYLNYKNLRPTYLEKFWDVVNWEQVSENFAAAKEGKVLGPQ